MHAHLQFAMADYLVSTLMIKMDENNHDKNDEQVKVTNIIDANEHLFIDITSLNSRSSGNNGQSNITQVTSNRRTLETLMRLETQQELSLYLYIACTLHHILDGKRSHALHNLEMCKSILNQNTILMTVE